MIAGSPSLVTTITAVAAIALNALWQDVVLVLFVWLALRVFPKINAATRHAVWSAALIAALIVPIATTLAFFTPAPPTVSAASVPAVVPASHASATRVSRGVEQRATETSRSTARLRSESSANELGVAPRRLQLTLNLPLAIAVFAIWALLAAVALVRLFIGLRRLEELKRDALPLPVEYRDAMTQWADADKGARPVRLCVSDEVDVPVAVGLFDSMILIPRPLLEQMSPQEVEQISLHELAHLRRADDWSNCAQRLIVAALGWNPAAAFVERQLELEREVACDDWVLSKVRTVRPYAQCLTKMAENAAWPHHPMPAPGVFTTRKQISLRIERLLAAGRDIATTLSIGPAAAAVAVVGAVALAIAVVAPSVAAPAVEMAQPAAPTQPAVAAVTAMHTSRPAVATHERLPAMEQKVEQLQHALSAQRARDARMVALATAAPATPSRETAVPKPPSNPTVAGAPVNVTVPNIPNLPNVDRIVRQAVSSATSATMSHMVGQTGNERTCVGCDFSGVNWSGRNMHGASYTGVDFTRANLSGVDFGGSRINGTDFSGANLSGASFAGAHMTGCDFSHANLRGANFAGAVIEGCQFNDAQLEGAQIRDVVNGCRGCDFSNADLRDANLRGIRASGNDFSRADLRNVDFSSAILTSADFSGAHMEGARFTGATLNGCDFSGVDISHVDFSGARLNGTDLPGRDSPP